MVDTLLGAPPPYPKGQVDTARSAVPTTPSEATAAHATTITGCPEIRAKQSGLGREGGHEGLLEFTESKYIATSW